MKKNILIISGLCVTMILLVVATNVYKKIDRTLRLEGEINKGKVDVLKKLFDPKNATYNIAGESVTLVNGFEERETAPDSVLKITTEYFGNDVSIDLNGDGRKDKVFLLMQNSGGSGTFFYTVAALDTEEGAVGSKGFFLGDRIAPQTTEISQNPNHKNVIVVNYFDRNVDEPMSEKPSMGKSVWLKFDSETMMFGEVEQNFPGEANPEVMSINMKQWTWIKTIYSNNVEIAPRKSDAFKITFEKDGSVYMSTDCNGMGGFYSINGNNIKFGSIAATEMYCEGSQEGEFSSMLEKVRSFSFTSKGELVLGLDRDGEMAIFR